MNKRNNLVISLAINDFAEENDDLFLEEINAANNNPDYNNTENSKRHIKKIISKYVKSNRSHKKAFIRAASIMLIVSISLTALSLSADGKNNKIFKLVTRDYNDKYAYILQPTSDNQLKLLEYEGKYVPSYIPEGYIITNITNNEYSRGFVMENDSRNIIMISEKDHSENATMAIDKEDLSVFEETEINGYYAIYSKKADGSETSILVFLDELMLSVISQDPSVDAKNYVMYIQEFMPSTH